VQEAFRRQINEIITDLPEYGWFGVCRTDGSTNPKPDGEFSAILYRKDRFRLLDGGTFWLSDTPDVVGSKAWDAAFPRIVTWAMFKDKNTDRDFFHFNTHFDHQGVQARDESAKLLLQKIQSIAGESPVLITGDFNCTVHDTPYAHITNDADAHHLIDAIGTSKNRHHGARGSFSPTFMISGLQENRIDYIFIKNNVKVLKHAIQTTGTENWLRIIYLSLPKYLLSED
jgi:endonuclease/exonuclease/phosphatase family metal-dependent hydrolase